MRAIHKRITHEDKFARDFHCNSDRFTSDMKRRNRKKMRRILKEKDRKLNMRV